MGLIFISCWLGTLWGHLVGVEVLSLVLGMTASILLTRWLGWKPVVLLLVGMASSWVADARQTGQNPTFDTYSSGKIHGVVEDIRCREGKGSSLRLADVTFQGEQVDERVTLWVAEDCSGRVGQKIE